MKLIIEDDQGRMTVVPFERDELSIGRDAANTIRLTERNVSRRHARLFRRNGVFFIEDLKSYNGVQLNGQRVQGTVSLNAGDHIRIGDYDLGLQDEAGANLGAADKIPIAVMPPVRPPPAPPALSLVPPPVPAPQVASPAPVQVPPSLRPPPSLVETAPSLPARREVAAPTEIQREPLAAPADLPLAGGLARVGAHIIDLVPALVSLRWVYLSAPWAPFVISVAVATLALAAKGTTLGQLVCGLRMCRKDGEPASLVQGALRMALQLGWLLLMAYFVAAAYSALPSADALGTAGLAWMALSWLGSAPAFFGSRRTLFDRLTQTSVLKRVRSA